MTTPQTSDPKVIQLERLVAQLTQQNLELHKRVSLLERENNRRKNEINQVARSK